MRKLLSYFRFRKIALLLYAATCAIFAAVSALAGLEWHIVAYALLLTGFALLVLLVVDGAQYFRRLSALDCSDGTGETLPPPANAPEAAYRNLLLAREAAFFHYRNEQAALRADALDYYTLWVHQIKTPIAALRLLLDGETSAAAGRELFKIEQYADLALRYVKLDDISSDLVVERCALLPIVRACVRKYSLLFIAKNLSVRIEALPETVVSDARWLTFIIEQLISNSVKYTNVGCVRIYSEHGALTVADTGIGIRAEDLPRVFEKGFTGVNGRLDTRASGIGLYLSKKAADALGIQISVRSVIGSGTTVSLTFPPEAPM